jgi:hypothetical protein
MALAAVAPAGPTPLHAGQTEERPGVDSPALGLTPIRGPEGLGLGVDPIINQLNSPANDFTSFIDSIPIPTHPFSPTYQPLPAFFSDWTFSTPSSHETANGSQVEIRDSALSRFGSRLPSLQPEDAPPERQQRDQKPKPSHRWAVSSQCRERIAFELMGFANVVSSDFVLPTRHALSRFVTGYFTGFHEHYPFLHVPTLRWERISPDLFLSIAAVGAQYAREPDIGLDLFHVAKAVVLERIRRRESQDIVPADSHVGESGQGGDPPIAGYLDYSAIEPIQTLLLLIARSTWFKRRPAAYEALSIRSVLDCLVRNHSVDEAEQRTDRWEAWIQAETRKRTTLVVFCFFNIHTIVFGLPPLMLSTEVHVDLPCSEREWKAECEQAWRDCHRDQGQDFQDAFQSLFGHRKAVYPCFSSLGGYVLIHAVIQHIWLVQQTHRLPHDPDRKLSADEIRSFERALKRWCLCWERNQESSMDPLNPDGPLSFTSTALLRLAYIRINMDVGSVRSLSTWDPEQIARSLHESPPVYRSDRLTRAALHCAHALSIPVKLGINFVAQTQVVYWSNQVALCSLECALLLAKWLESVTQPDPNLPLTPAEERVLDFVIEMVAETEFNASRSQLFANNRVLGSIVVRLWAKLFRSDSVWEMVDLIGRSLRVYADLLINGNN